MDCNMKKFPLILIALITLTNVSYASFPVSDTLKVKQDTLQIEEIKQYHSNLIKMGIDLNDCRCKSCRKSNKSLKKNTMHQSATGLYILSGLILLGVIIWLSIGLTRMYNCINSMDGSDCPQSAGQTQSGAPIEMLWMTLLILISAGVALTARFIQIRNKRNILKNN